MVVSVVHPEGVATFLPMMMPTPGRSVWKTACRTPSSVKSMPAGASTVRTSGPAQLLAGRSHNQVLRYGEPVGAMVKGVRRVPTGASRGTAKLPAGRLKLRGLADVVHPAACALPVMASHASAARHAGGRHRRGRRRGNAWRSRVPAAICMTGSRCGCCIEALRWMAGGPAPACQFLEAASVELAQDENLLKAKEGTKQQAEAHCH